MPRKREGRPCRGAPQLHKHKATTPGRDRSRYDPYIEESDHFDPGPLTAIEFQFLARRVAGGFRRVANRRDQGTTEQAIRAAIRAAGLALCTIEGWRERERRRRFLVVEGGRR